MKLLKPSFREKKRYLLLEGNFSKKEIEEIIMKYVGILGYAKASPMWISGKILAINRSEINHIRGAFVLSKKVSVKKVSGTLKGLKI
ncbi:hypothetical protein COU53_00275 [Candidatus Pacearchaeota archaeon CG10_big_fil_rev_8_21_14_0_10_30_48]|nr:MAG: hypothetical protein COU53_00275 [Candidatus Pacearchaeota archaeon CG10_big_fil_rev_8_21_14_0_10_30_48]